MSPEATSLDDSIEVKSGERSRRSRAERSPWELLEAGEKRESAKEEKTQSSVGLDGRPKEEGASENRKPAALTGIAGGTERQGPASVWL